MRADRTLFVGLIAAGTLVAGLSLSARQAGAPPAGAPSAGPAGPPSGEQPQGRGGRGGRGGAQGSQAEPDFSPRPPVQPLSPDAQAARFWLPEGFRMEVVLSEPHTEEPGQIAFDGNGRMFVAELRGYMQDLEATGQFDPVGRITVHEDRDNDGRYETHGIFVDNLVFPRWVMPIGKNSVLTMESNADEVWKFTDTDNDGVAETKEFFAAGFGRLTNVELQQSGLTWALDNWMYSTVNQHRVRWTPRGVLREPTSYNNGQWGVTQDNYGTIYFQGGGSGLPTYFQFPPVYGYFDNPNRFEPNLNITWGAPVLVADMVGGMGSVRMPDGSNVRTTAGAGNDVFRGHRLPPDMVGDYFYGEPVSRIVRRLRPVKQDGLTELRNVYPLSEFIRSTDPLFRPVDMTTAPDGTMYITDMYRGVVQEREWNRPGSYLRQRIAQYQLDKVVRHGRIWRLRHVDHPRDTRQPRMLDETPRQLLAHLGHPNGWWRDTAQQLLVLRQDTSVVPALRELAGTSRNQLERIHALWTLEGLGAADPAIVRSLMKADDAQVRIQAIRVSETLYKGGDRSFAGDYRSMAQDRDVNVALQALMTSNILRIAGTPDLVRETMAARSEAGVRLVGNTILNPPANVAGGRGGIRPDGLPEPFAPEEATAMERGERAYSEICAACHGLNGRGEPIVGGASSALRAPSLAESTRVQGHRDNVVKALLHGVTGPIDGQTYDDVMIPMGASPDQWVADVASYVRNAFGSRETFVSAEDVARVRRATAARTAPWTAAEIEASAPKLVIRSPAWRITASHRSEAAPGALGFEPWESGEPMAPGMWLQVEFPQPLTVTEVQFQSAAPRPRSADSGTGTTSINYGGPPPPPEQVGYPRGYEIRVSMDGATWSEPVARGAAAGPKTTVTFAPVAARFVRLIQTAALENAPPLSVLQLRFYEAPAAR